MFRSLLALTTLFTLLGTSAFAAGTLSEAIPVPGGTVALARAIGLETPLDPSRFVAELARLTYGHREGHLGPATKLQRLTSYLDVATGFRAALDRVPDGTLTLALASGDKRSRDGLNAVLEFVNLHLRESGGAYAVEAGIDHVAASRVDLLTALGVNIERLGPRLNAGESIQLALPTELVPVPLTTSIWSDAVFHRPLLARDLFAAIFSDASAALLCHGLSALDDETLAYVVEHRSLLARLSREEAPVFAAFASNLHVRGGRVVTPGGPPAVPLWEAVVDATTANPELFIRALLSKDGGHLVYLYDLIAELDVSRGAFALGLWIENDRARVDRFKTFVSTVHSSLATWQVHELPFNRPLDDIGWMLLHLPVEFGGAPRGPAAIDLWSQVFEPLDVMDEAAARKAVARVDQGRPFDAAWLANAVLTPAATQRRQRLQQLAFGLRAFSAARPDAFGDVVVALRALPVYTAPMLVLERMGITEPAVHAAVVRASRRLSDLSGDAACVALSQFQGSMVLLSRMTAAGSLDRARASALVSSLAAIPLSGDGYGPLVVRWLRDELLPAIVPKNDAEDTVLAALAGETGKTERRAARVSWEGEEYRLDLPASEVQRLLAIRRMQRVYSVETAVSLEGVASALGADTVDLSDIERAVAALRALVSARPTETAAGAPRLEGVGHLPDAAAFVDRVLKDLSKITKADGARKAKRSAETLSDVSGVVLAEALSSLAYALNLEDVSEGTLLDADLWRRHDFGLTLLAKPARRREAWAIPRQIVTPGSPRRVSGSLLALDVAFARLMLRRVVLDDVDSSPVLLANDRETFTRSVALLDPYSMRDADRDAIATALSRGRRRIDAVAAGSTDGDTLESIAADVKLDGWRRRAAQWDLEHDPERLPSLFSLTELLVLGAGKVELFQGWGMAGTPVSDCLCTRVAAPNEWRIVGGRSQIGSLSTTVPDLNLHVAAMLSTLRLPAQLARMVVGAAMNDFVDRVRPNDPNDWLTLVRGASLASRQRIEDYVAAATAHGPLLPEASYREPQP